MTITQVGDHVRLDGDASGALYSVTDVQFGHIQIDGKRWVRPIEVIPVEGVVAGDEARTKNTATKRSPPKSSGEYIDILEKDLSYRFELCTLDDRVYVNGDPLDDVTEAVIRTQMRDRGEYHVEIIRDAYITHAADNSFHPVKRFFEGLQYDGQDHIGELTMMVEDEHNAFSFIFRRWLIGCVAKVFEQAQNPMLVLDGDQNLGKSFFAQWLCSPLKDFFIESPISPDSKDHKSWLMSKFIWEVAELGSTTRRADREALKHFLTMENVTIRLPYARNTTTKPALASFIGTVNNEAGILNDPTGSRRFLVVHLNSIDWSYSEDIDVEQLWAQAYHLYACGEGWKLDSDEFRFSQEINEEYQIEDPLSDHITSICEFDPTRLDWTAATNDILEAVHNRGWRLSSPRAESLAVAAEMKARGYRPKRISLSDGSRVRGYEGVQMRTWSPS